MTSYFRSQKLWDIVSEGYNIPADITDLDDNQKKELDKNQQKYSQALFVLQQAVADEIFPRIMGATTAKEAWDTQQEEFQGSVKLCRMSVAILKFPWKKCSLIGSNSSGQAQLCIVHSEANTSLEKDQLQELVLGFELTGCPFLIALKPPMGCETIEEALPNGFQERVKAKGLVYGGWVQQPQILSHKLVLHSKMFVEELKVAVKVDKDENGWFSKENLSEVIKSVMDKDSEVGLMVKKNHENLRRVLEKPGFMSGYVDMFVRNLREIVINPSAGLEKDTK
ncbi:hypothetical protein FEM48_Zijuj12G0108400 [Ziziphus jujuba var. spinosa]|uniref:Uncharacterized protein n=1 Tax=Ziziphus jujuba var. spinosa TaxID=714518 RepID=A0A978UCW2_ZIZJJ|nr:hypothetical protein FEM48_Zijuj12G0108400 [Ziziphus jujuba var. spinosa]